VTELRFGSDRNAEAARQLDGVGDRIEVLPDRVLVYSADGEAVLDHAVRVGLRPTTSLVRRSSLEDVFLRLTGRSLIE
jgi:lipooligosaccharide transport system ATP-binding protein